MLGVGLVAIDATILATAVPAIVTDLGGFTQFPWLFSVYLLAQAVSVPIYGKLADMVGRKPIMLIGIGLFVVGSVLCGFAWSMPALIAFRVLQGLGAGAVQPMAMTIVGDLYSLAERAKVQGYIASVWGVSSVVGPTLGGVFVDYLSWRWIFFVNIPVGIAAAWVLARRFEEQVVRGRHRIDYAGATLLTIGGTALLLGLLEGGVVWAWSSFLSVFILTSAVAMLIAFGIVERRAAEPIVPLWIFRVRVLNAANGSVLLVGVILIGLTTYVPLYAQGVLGTSALTAGFALAAMTIGWPISASYAGRLYLSIGFRATMLVGAAFSTLGSVLLLTVDPASPVLQLAAACFVVGVGLGFVASPAVVAAQSSVGWDRRGVVTGVSMFSRSVGSAVGVAAFGAVANAAVAARIGATHPNLEELSAAILDPAIRRVFLGAAVAGFLLLASTAFMIKRLPEPAEG
jgi:EmrB/QacA subfamily drug resistance transporter